MTAEPFTLEQADEIEAHFAPWLERNLDDVQLFIDCRADLSEDVLFVLRRLLKLAGLRLQSEQIMRDGVRFRYSLDLIVRQELEPYIRRALQARREREAERQDDPLLKTRTSNYSDRVLSNPLAPSSEPTYLERLQADLDEFGRLF